MSLAYQWQLGFPDMKEIRRVYQALGSYLQLAVGSGIGESFDFDLTEFALRFQIEPGIVHSCTRVLEQDGWIAMSDSVFIPSTIRVVADKQDIYRYRVENKTWDQVLKGIFRSAHGVYEQAVAINEQALATFIGISVIDLKNVLDGLHQRNIIEYLPHKDKPQITFLQGRADMQHFSINQNLYEFRKKRARYRMEKALEYAELDICRSRQLLAYFGEKRIGNCGVCDVCLEKNTAELDNAAFEAYQKKIETLLRFEPLSLKELVDSFGMKHRANILKVLEFMMDNDMVNKKEDKLGFF